MKILLVTGNFAAPGINPWLLDDLADSFVSAGHEVDVVVHSPTAPRPRELRVGPSGIRVLSVGAVSAPGSAIAKLRSYLATGFRLHTTGARFASTGAYDLCVYTSIGLFSFGFPSRVRRRGTAARLLFVMWDFFPVHQVEIGRIRPAVLAPFLKRLERMSIRRSDVVAVMSAANEKYLKSYHRSLSADVIQIPPWASDAQPTSPLPVKRERFTAIFGGQLVKGRGVDTLLDAAKLLELDGLPIDILIAGDGSDAAELRKRATELKLTNVSFLGSLHREIYRTVLQTSHVGIAVTVPGISPPSFPSKIVEYCANGLPVLVCVEASSDAGEYVQSNGAGLAAPAGDAPAIARALGQLLSEHNAGLLEQSGIRARSLFLSAMSSHQAVATMVAAASGTRTETSK